MSPNEVVETEVLIIGGGGAGTRAAIEAARQGAKVLLVNKGLLARSGLTTPPPARGSWLMSGQ